MHRSPSRFLVRPSHLTGESLSSWRQRTAWANGYRLFPVVVEPLRRSDPDMGRNESDLKWMAALHDTTPSRCLDMTLSGLTGRLFDQLASRSQPRWWLRCRYNQTGPHHGSMYCPRCLAEDVIPYFRLSWRFAFTTVCTKHDVLLADQCPQCGRPPWPSACAVGDRIDPHFTAFDQCPYCGASLGCATQSRSAPSSVADYATDAPERIADLFGACSVESLAAIRSVCHLFMRTSPRRAIIASDSRWSTIARSLSTTCLQQNSIEHAPVEDRHLLVNASLEICRCWPESFQAFASEVGISRVHFNGSTAIQPAWMNAVVDEHLALQNRFVTEEDKHSTFKQLEEALGRRPFKYELRSALRWRGDKGLDALYAD